MLFAGKRIAAGAGLAPTLVQRAATVALDWDTRQKSRFDATDSSGRAIGVVLPRGTVLRGGDVLVVDDGSLVRVQAMAQPVLRVTVAAGGDPRTLARAAYHLGNRHVPLEVRGDHLQLEPDHVLAELLRRMRFAVEEIEAPFEPEGGAYDVAANAHAHAHVHGPGCGHDHG